MVQRTVKRHLRHTGYDMYRVVQSDVSPRNARERHQAVLNNTINVVFDIGANAGTYGLDLRSAGYTERIISFAPVSSDYTALKAAASGDMLWETVQSALGDFNGAEEVSVHPYTPHYANTSRISNEDSAETPQQATTEDIVVSRLDAILDTFVEDDERCFVKIDNQGFGTRELMGAEGVMNRICGVQIDVPQQQQTHNSDDSLDSMIHLMHTHGFTLVSIEPATLNGGSGHSIKTRLTFIKH